MAVTPGSGLQVFVSVVEERIAGVIGFGPEHGVITVFSMGVLIEYQGRGLGTALKRSAMAEVAARYGVVDLVSIVHRANGPMLRVNKKLEVSIEPDPDDGEYRFTAVTVEEAAAQGAT